MKKAKLMLFFIPLVISIFFLIPVKVLAITLETTPEDWHDYITQFDDGYVVATIEFIEEWDWDEFAVIVLDAPGNEFDGCYIHYVCLDYAFREHFDYQRGYESILGEGIGRWLIGRGLDPDTTLSEAIELLSDGEIEYNGLIYWNFEEKYWQIDYYNKSEFNNKEVDMVTDLLETLAEIGAGIGDLFGKIVESVGQFFYTPGTGDTPGSFTIIGILTIAAVVISLSMWVLRLILRLFKLRG